MNEELIISLTPKISETNLLCHIIERKPRVKTAEIKHNSFLEPLDKKELVRLNATSPLGLSSVSRIGKG